MSQFVQDACSQAPQNFTESSGGDGTNTMDATLQFSNPPNQADYNLLFSAMKGRVTDFVTVAKDDATPKEYADSTFFWIDGSKQMAGNIIFAPHPSHGASRRCASFEIRSYGWKN